MFDNDPASNYYCAQCSRCKWGEWRGGCLNSNTAEDGSDLDEAVAGKCAFFEEGEPQSPSRETNVRVSAMFKLPVRLWNGDVVEGEFASDEVTLENAIRAVVDAYADVLGVDEAPSNGAPLHVKLTRAGSPKIESAATAALFTAAYVKGYAFVGREDLGDGTTIFTFNSKENT